MYFYYTVHLNGVLQYVCSKGLYKFVLIIKSYFSFCLLDSSSNIDVLIANAISAPTPDVLMDYFYQKSSELQSVSQTPSTMM